MNRLDLTYSTPSNLEPGAPGKDIVAATIRAEGVNLTVRNCYFHDNQDGILESNVAVSNTASSTTTASVTAVLTTFTSATQVH